MFNMAETDDELDPNVRDHLTTIAKSALGAVPFAGSLLAEVAGSVIPNQRVDRLVSYAQKLEAKLAGVEQQLIRSQVTNENFTDLLEESMRQAARSVSDERRQYIANLVSNGIKSSEIEYFESKHLLRILGELNDVECFGSGSTSIRLSEGTRSFVRSMLTSSNQPRSYSAHLNASSTRTRCRRAIKSIWCNYGCSRRGIRLTSRPSSRCSILKQVRRRSLAIGSRPLGAFCCAR